MVDSSDHSCNQQLSDRDVALHLLGHPPENEEEELDAQTEARARLESEEEEYWRQYSRWRQGNQP